MKTPGTDHETLAVKPKRSYFGTLGSACDVVTAINGEAVADGANVSLPSEATLRIRSNGGWIYRPAPTAAQHPAAGVDSFSYTLQTPAGAVNGTMSVFLSPPSADRQVLTRSDASLAANSGDGTCTNPVRLRYRVMTGTPVMLELRSASTTDVAADRAVVMLDSSSVVNARVLPTGFLGVEAAAGFCGMTTISTLVETATGYSEWVDVELDVIPACLFVDSLQSAVNTAQPPCRERCCIVRTIVPYSRAPVFQGQCRPLTVVIGRLQTENEEVTAQIQADAAGYWSMTLRNATVGRPGSVSFEYANRADTFDLQLNPPADSSYREVESPGKRTI